jgi:hypothetical protein
MCIEVFRDTGKAFAAATRKKSVSRTSRTLVASALMIAVAVAILGARGGNLTSGLYFALNVFVLVIGTGIIGGYIIRIIANALGAKGGFYEGFTALSYALAPMTAGILIAAILTMIPTIGIALGVIAVIVLFALGIAVLYRGIKEMFRTDIFTSFVTVSILTISLIIGIYATLGLNILASMSRMVPV